MRSKLLLFVGCIFLAACADIKETGISRSQAISIAKRACPEYPERFGFVDQAQWVPEKGFWSVLLADNSGYHGRVYRIDRNGSVVGTSDVNEARPVGYYGGPYYYDGPGPYYYGGGPTIIVGGYHGGYRYHRW